MGEVMALDGLEPPIYNSRACLWLNVKQIANKSLAKVVDKEGSFNFFPY